MTDGLRRVRCLRRAAPAVAVVLIGPSQAMAGFGSPPVMHPGQLVSTYYPHQTSAVPTSAARDQAGRIVAVGQLSTRFAYANPTSTGVAVARFTASERPDTAFGSAGSTVSYATGAIPTGQSVTPQIVTPMPGGGLLVGGFTVGHIFIERFAADGALDRSFGSDGIVDRPESSQALPGGVLALTPLADGEIVFVHSEPQPQGASSKDVFPGGLLIDRLAPNGAQLSEVTYGPPEWTVGTSSSYPQWAVAHVFADGSVLAAGSRVIPYTLPCPCTSQLEFLLRRFHPDGSVDTSFGTGGSTTTRFGDVNAFAQSLAVSSDGTIVVGGTTSGGSEDKNVVDVVRYGPDGTPDTSFGQGGTATVVGGNGSAVAVAADGSVFLSSNQQVDLSVVKLAPDGSPAPGFGSGGRASTLGGGRATAVFPGADGGVTVVIGSWNSVGGFAGDDFALVRYTSAGALDTAFGRQSIPVGLPPPAGALAIATAAGEIATAGFQQDEAGRVGMHVELIDQGLPQKTFGPNGGVTLFAGETARATAVGIDSSGRVVAGGDSSTGGATRWLVARFRADGTPDPTFGAAGIVISPDTGAGDGLAGLAVLPDSRTLLLVHQGGRALLIRLAADGALDPGFGGAGRVAVPVPGAAALAVLPDGHAVVAGDGLACAFVDAHGGVSAVSDPALASAVSVGIDVQRNGAFVIAGSTPAGLSVARRLSNGALDPSFGSGGVATRDGVDAAGIAVQRDGRIDVAVRPRAAARFAVVRFLATGQVDSSFGDGGLAGAVDGGVANAISGGGLLVAGTAPSPRGTDFGLVALYQDSPVYTVVGDLFHVTPKGVVRHVADGATQPVWSPAAGKLAYVTNDAGAADIAVGRGRTAHLITDSPLLDGAVVVGNPEWSRDGKLLAVRVRDGVGNPAFAVFSARGGQPRRIVGASSALWAAGHDLAFETDGAIKILDADTGRVRRVTAGLDVVPAPHGKLMAVSLRVWTIVRPDGTVVTRLPARFYDPQWAPDGHHLSGFDRGQLAVVDLRGHERRLPVHAGEEARAPVWSLDGRLIAFVNKTGGAYYIEFVDTATGKPVSRWSPGTGFGHANPTWDPTGIYIPTS